MKNAELSVDQAGGPQGKYQGFGRKGLSILRHDPHGNDPGIGFDNRCGRLDLNRFEFLHVVICNGLSLENGFDTFATHVRQFDTLGNPAPAIGEYQPKQSHTQYQ
jgi:hypothetical protein